MQKLKRGWWGYFLPFSLPLGSTYCWLTNVMSFLLGFAPYFAQFNAKGTKKIQHVGKQEQDPFLCLHEELFQQIEQYKSHLGKAS